MRELRIHHFFDIMRDYGSGKSLSEHAYGHSYHTIGNELFENKTSTIKIVIKNDDICENCTKLNQGKCIDTIHHRSDFLYKQEFNDYLDTRIMNCMGYEDGQVIEVMDIVKNAHKYLVHIFELYDGNDIEHTELRKQNVSIGIDKKTDEFCAKENLL